LVVVAICASARLSFCDSVRPRGTLTGHRCCHDPDEMTRRRDLRRLCDIDADRPYRLIAMRYYLSEDLSDPYPIENSQTARKPLTPRLLKYGYDATCATLSENHTPTYDAFESHVLASECNTIVCNTGMKASARSFVETTYLSFIIDVSPCHQSCG
jgi:hypothetical protein